MSKEQEKVTIADLRKDEVKPSTSRKEILKGKENDGTYFIVPKVRD